MAFFCGAGSFSHADDDPWLPSTLTGSKRRQAGGGGNPYSDRGLDKFYLLLADLETRREKVMAAAGSQGVALVQFVYSSSDDWVPIVVRPREQPPPRPAKKPRKGAAAQALKRPGPPEERPALPPPPQPQQQQQHAAEQAGVARDRVVRKSLSSKACEGERGRALWCRWCRPSHYLPAAVVLVLLCLAVFGRAFAICCTSIWWYSVPISAAKSRDVRRPVKKDYGRRASERTLGATTGGADSAATAQGRRAGGLEGVASPRKHHASMKRGSW